MVRLWSLGAAHLHRTMPHISVVCVAVARSSSFRAPPALSLSRGFHRGFSSSGAHADSHNPWPSRKHMLALALACGSSVFFALGGHRHESLASSEPTDEQFELTATSLSGQGMSPGEIKQLVLQSEDDVLVEIYATDCPSCRKMNVVVDQLAHALKHERIKVRACSDGVEQMELTL